MDIRDSALPFPDAEESRFGTASVCSNGLDFERVSRSVCNAAESSRTTASSGYGSVFPTSHRNSESLDSHSVSTVTEAVSKSTSTLNWMFSRSTSSVSLMKRTQWIHRRRPGCKHSNSKSLNDRKPVLLKKMPFGKSSKYLTVYVGARIEQSVKFVISRSLLVHPLFQILLKCSEDEFGEDYAVKNGVAIVCDVALFLQIVRTVDDSLCSARTTEARQRNMSISARA